MCELNKHELGVSYDIDYTCKQCSYEFPGTGFYKSDSYWLRQIKPNLIERFGSFWELEWYKLKATRQIVRAIRIANKKDGRVRFDLNMYKVYILKDFGDEPFNFDFIEPRHETIY